MKVKSPSCPEMHSIVDRFKAGNPLRDLHNRCGKTKRRCRYAKTSKVREAIPAEKIRSCSLRRR